MAGFAALLLSYIIGGVTLLPLLLLAAGLHAYLYLPTASGHTHEHDPTISQKERNQELEEKLAQHANEPDATSGYFSVCREFVPGGVNGKPPERITPTGEAVTADGQSVYQSMYKSLFDRSKVQPPTLDHGKGHKKGRNVFFLAIRHSHLVLFDNEQQLEIRHVISLAHHVVDVYAGGEEIPEGELWIKRNCIRLRKKVALLENDVASPPFYLFCDNSPKKEDFYHALLRTQKHDSQSEAMVPAPLPFEADSMIKLIRQLHVSEESSQTRWLNALIGRLFLALYKTQEIEDHIRNKISKKISRVAKPAFISSIGLRQVDMGDGAPSFLNPKLKEMTMDGALTIEADVRYSGNFKAVISAIARIDLGNKLKAREVNLILAGVLKRMEGHVLFKIKPPPSNRMWFSFETMPKLDISLEPIVSSRQITYGVILSAIITRIQAVVAETLVLPNWDDLPFTNTDGKGTRGGIWKHSEGPQSFTEAEKALKKRESEASDNASISSDPLPSDLKSAATDTQNVSGASSIDETNAGSSGLTPSKTLDNADVNPASVSTPAIAHTAGVEKPKAMRSHSFAAAATPIVSKSPAATERHKPRHRKGRKDAASTMQGLANRSPELSPTHTPQKPILDGSPHESPELIGKDQEGLSEKTSNHQEGADRFHHLTSTLTEPLPHHLRTRATTMTEPVVPPTRSTTAAAKDRTKAFNQSLTSATAAATKWSLGMLNMQEKKEIQPPEKPPRPEPMGRGQPLPPPGMPLPKPEKQTWSATAFNTLRRKPVANSQGEPSNKPTSAAGSPAQKGKTAEPTRSRAVSEESKSRMSSEGSNGKTSNNEPNSEASATQQPKVQQPSKEPKSNSSSPSLKIDSAPNSQPASHASSKDNLMTISMPTDSTPSTPRPRTPEPEYAKEMGEGAFTSPMTGG